MKKVLNRIRVWLNDARRQAVHAALGTLATLGVTVGLITDEQSTALLGLTGSVLVLAQGALGLLLLHGGEGYRWFDTVGRGLIYAAAAAAGAVGVVFGIVGDETVTHWLGILSVGLTVVSSFLGVVNVQTVPSDADGRPLTRREYRALLAR
ncbi:hypothetical protein [Microbacterium sp. NPDC091662]|uniref:hypothetical protein n=1 Tax=Microbacterium sp. NPDC091662 TaxID=3364211 RepID=UPI00381F168C